LKELGAGFKVEIVIQEEIRLRLVKVILHLETRKRYIEFGAS
jgi:hypothetical protein